MKTLYTIGYEGSTAELLIETLVAMDVRLLADVRALPLSRKKGLSKRSLAAALAEAGIEYQHFKMLGDPKPGRDAARAGKLQTFERIYTSHLHTPEAQKQLSDLLEVAESKKTCMLCFERSAHVCHRSYIADEADNLGFHVYNLVADRPHEYRKNGIKIPRYNSRKSLSAAE